jgi:type I restriction enzyme S subunit
MEVKPGYKQTDVGVIPEEWEGVPLKGKVSIAHGYAFASQHFAAHGPYRLATPGHFYEAGGFRDVGEKQKFYVGSVPPDYVLEPGDVIVAMTEQADGLLGSAAVIPNEYGYLHNQRLGRVRTLSPDIDLGYLVNAFNSPAYRTKVRETAAGTKVKHTSPDKLLEIAVRLPPLPEQRAIAEALSDVDGLLGGLDRLIAKKRDLKQAAMQQLLTGQTRLPGFQGEWEVKTLGQLITHCFSGATPRRNRPDFYNGNIRWITSGELNYNVITDTIEKITPEAVARTNLTIIPKGTFLMAITGLEAAGTRGSCGIVGEPSTTNQSCMAVFPTKELVTEYLFHYYVFRGDALALQYCQGTKQQSYTAKLVKKLPISIPPTTAEQTAIAEVLSEMDGELAVLEQRREKTRALKQAMMQELLTGRTRLI